MARWFCDVGGVSFRILDRAVGGDPVPVVNELARRLGGPESGGLPGWHVDRRRIGRLVRLDQPQRLVARGSPTTMTVSAAIRRVVREIVFVTSAQPSPTEERAVHGRIS